jgi:hypothetical protein
MASLTFVERQRGGQLDLREDGDERLRRIVAEAAEEANLRRRGDGNASAAGGELS